MPNGFAAIFEKVILNVKVRSDAQGTLLKLQDQLRVLV